MVMQNQQQGRQQGQQQFGDRDIAQVVLNELKNMAHAVNTYILEATEDNLRRDYMTNLGDIYSTQKQISDTMQQKGWYTVKSAQQQDIAQAQNKFVQQMGAQLQ